MAHGARDPRPSPASIKTRGFCAVCKELLRTTYKPRVEDPFGSLFEILWRAGGRPVRVNTRRKIEAERAEIDRPWLLDQGLVAAAVVITSPPLQAHPLHLINVSAFLVKTSAWM